MSGRKIIAVVGLILLVGASAIFISAFQRASNKAQCAAEGEAAVESFLRRGGDGAFTNLGPFIKLDGEGYYNAVWNIQGYEYIGLNRQAQFASNTVRLRIIVRGDRGAKQVGQPYIEGPLRQNSEIMISVTHPNL